MNREQKHIEQQGKQDEEKEKEIPKKKSHQYRFHVGKAFVMTAKCHRNESVLRTYTPKHCEIQLTFCVYVCLMI